MSIRASRTNIVLRPDPSRVFFRPFDLDSHERITRVVARVTALERCNAEQEAMIMLDRFMERHVKLKGFFLRRFEEVRELILPYAMSDQCTSFATVPMDKLLSELKAHPPDSLL
jgi:hypothetical protein